MVELPDNGYSYTALLVLLAQLPRTICAKLMTHQFSTYWLRFYPTCLRMLACVTILGHSLVDAPSVQCEDDLSATQQAPNFIRDVVPVLVKTGCSGGKCHGSFQGRGGFQLSLLGFKPEQDFESLTREGRSRRVSVSAPMESLIFRKALGRIPHGGGKRFREDSVAFRRLDSWLRAGALPPEEFDLHVTKIDVEPAEIVLQPGGEVLMNIRAHWSDGVTEDVTHWSLFEVRDEKHAEVNKNGHIKTNEPGRTSLTVTFMGQVKAVTITVPHSKPDQPLEFASQNFIDELVAIEWEKLGLRPVELADDATFIRRVSLDITGTLPTPEEIRTFFSSTDVNKRAKLIDELLERDDYVDFWAHKWADLLRVHRRYVGDKGLWTFWNWVRQMVRENWPTDRIAKEVLTARGSLFNNGATAYFFVDTDPAQLAETTSQLFLGVRMQCAKCHHHPYEVWSQEDYYGLANFFTRLEIKDNGDGARYGGAKLLRPIPKPSRTRRVQMNMSPTLFGREIDPESTTDVRIELADWITSKENAFFDRNFVNRYWSYFMGRGLVEPVDDLRATNPASHPELLEALQKDFVSRGRDLKHLIRKICNSRVYQLASRARSERDRSGMFYTHRKYRRLPAAVMLDAVNHATELSEDFQGLPKGTRALSLPDPTIPSYFLEAFGRSTRSSPCECATSNEPDLAQSLHFINSSYMNDKITHANGRLGRLLKEDLTDTERIEELFLVTWSRLPSETEKAIVEEIIEKSSTPREAYEDILWAMLNSAEFVFNR